MKKNNEDIIKNNLFHKIYFEYLIHYFYYRKLIAIIIFVIVMHKNTDIVIFII
jgi:hypothetical protein